MKDRCFFCAPPLGASFNRSMKGESRVKLYNFTLTAFIFYVRFGGGGGPPGLTAEGDMEISPKNEAAESIFPQSRHLSGPDTTVIMNMLKN